MTKKIYSGVPASASFKAAVEGGGNTCMTCGYCGREHIAIDSSNHGAPADYDENGDDTPNYIFAHDCLIDDMRKMAIEDPDTWILTENVDFIHGADMNGIMIPDDCPCNGLGQYEDFIISQIPVIKRFMAIKKLSLQAELEQFDGL